MGHKTMDRVREALQPEYKTFPMHHKAINDRTVTTLFSVSGNVDLVQDVVWPGAFTNTIAQRSSKVFHLWQHDSYNPPIAIVKSINEIGRDQLPQEVLAQYPQASGGTEAVSEFLSDERSDAIFQALKVGAPFEASFAYDAIRYDYQEIDGEQVRNLRELRLWEISTVLWGANEATLGDVGKLLLPVDILLKQIEAHLANLKSGARHSSADLKMLNEIHNKVVELGATSCKGVVGSGEEDPAKKPDVEEEDPDKEAEKSRAAAMALTQLRRKFQLLELETSIL